MQELDLFKIFTTKLDELKLNYFITGSIASIIYGEPRLTHDIDIVLEIYEHHVEHLIKKFPDKEFYIPPSEVIKNELLRTERGHFNLIHNSTGFKADIYLIGKNDFQKWALENKNKIDYLKSSLFIAPPEYVIIKKLEYYKEGQADKHLNDIRSILVNSEDIIDFKTVEKFAIKFGVLDLWEMVKEGN